MRSVTPLLVAIVGGSGAGKSWLAKKLQARLGKQAARLSLDDFYRDRSGLSPSRRAKLNFDHPRAIDWGSVERVLRDLLAGRAAYVPRYDFKTHTRGRSPHIFKAKPIILVDGLWLLRRPSLRRLFELRIFLDCKSKTRLRRRLTRDLKLRGRTAASVREQFRKTVEPMHRKYVEEQTRWANVVVQGSCSEQAVSRIAHLLGRFKRER